MQLSVDQNIWGRTRENPFPSVGLKQKKCKLHIDKSRLQIIFIIPRSRSRKLEDSKHRERIPAQESTNIDHQVQNYLQEVSVIVFVLTLMIQTSPSGERKKNNNRFLKRTEVLEGVVDFEDGRVCPKLIVRSCEKHSIPGVHLFLDRHTIR